MLHFGAVDHNMQRFPGPQTPGEQTGAEQAQRQHPFAAGSQRGRVVMEPRPCCGLRLALAELEAQQPRLSRFVVHAIAGVDAFAAIDAAVIDRRLAWIDFDEAGAHAITALVATRRATRVVAHVQGLAGTKAVLPNPINTGEATPEVTDK